MGRNMPPSTPYCTISELVIPMLSIMSGRSSDASIRFLRSSTFSSVSSSISRLMFSSCSINWTNQLSSMSLLPITSLLTASLSVMSSPSFTMGR